MELHIDGIADGQPIPPRHAFCAGTGLGDNISPALRWSGTPEGTRSIAISCVDPDAPTDGSDVNVEGRTVPADMPRTDFAHWLLVDLEAAMTELAEGESGSGVVHRGKPVEVAEAGGVRGANDYTSWFADDIDMDGVYGGYDGPCPPNNDELVHHYVFTVYALDIETAGLSSGFRLADFRAAIEGHVLASARLTGTYTLNPDLG